MHAAVMEHGWLVQQLLLLSMSGECLEHGWREHADDWQCRAMGGCAPLVASMCLMQCDMHHCSRSTVCTAYAGRTMLAYTCILAAAQTQSHGMTHDMRRPAHRPVHPAAGHPP